MNSFSETIQWYSNVLLNTIPIEKNMNTTN